MASGSQYFVYNVSHVKSSIKSSCGQIRILGVFDHAKAAEAHVEKLAKIWPDLEIRLSPVKSWRILSHAPMALEEQSERLAELLVTYRESRDKVFQDTLARAAARQSVEDFEGPMVSLEPHDAQVSSDKPIEKHQRDPSSPEAPSPMAMVVPVLPTDLEVPRQKYIGLAVIPDVLKKDHSNLGLHEPAFQVISVSDNEGDIRKALDEFANRPLIDQVESLYKSIPMACVSMYEFIRPAYIMKIPTVHESRVPKLQELKEAFHVHEMNKDGGHSYDGPESLAQSTD